MDHMSIKTDLQEALKAALKSGQTLRKTTVRMALASIKNAEVEAREELKDDLVLNLLGKEVKARQETIEGAKQAKRPDLISKAEEEIQCNCAEIISGRGTPNDCPSFGISCTSRHPIGPCMVAQEGICASYFRYTFGRL